MIGLRLSIPLFSLTISYYVICNVIVVFNSVNTINDYRPVYIKRTKVTINADTQCSMRQIYSTDELSVYVYSCVHTHNNIVRL